jgi:flagellar basal-body rod protein FlgB
MSWLDSATLRGLQTFLDLSVRRQALITGNIANVDTPGYRTIDIDFHGELSRAMNSDDPAPTLPTVHEVSGLTSRPDGNNVSVDRESLLLAEVQLQFRVATEILESKFKNLSTAITSGGSTI